MTTFTKTFSCLYFLLLTLPMLAQNGLDFDGTNDYVSSSQPGPTGTSDRTVEAWIKTSTSISTQQIIVDWGTFALGQRFTLNLIDFGKLRIEVSGSGFNSTSSIADGLWHHVAVTYDHSATTKFNMYIDGVLHTSQNLVTSVNTGSGNGITIGRRIDGVNYFDGVIDEVKIWNDVRTATEISNNMNNELCSIEQGLVAYYNFNQGNAGMTNTGLTTLTNLVGSNMGTLNNFGLSGSSSNWVTGKTLNSGMSFITTTDNGCDSAVSPSGNYTWYTSGVEFDTLMKTNGCDSILAIDLDITQSDSIFLAAESCGPYTSPGGTIVWLSSGIYTEVLTNSAGCDSVYTVDLNVINLDNSVSLSGGVLTSNDANAQYQWIDCSDSSILANDTNQVFEPTQKGSYAVILSNGLCSDTSDCVDVMHVGVNNWKEAPSISIYPNPSDGQVFFKLNNQTNDAVVFIRDLQGRVVQSHSLNGITTHPLNLDELPGVYILEVVSEGQSSIHKLLLR